MHGALQTRARRPLIFLAVCLCHGLIFLALLRTAWSPPDRRRLADDPLTLILLPSPRPRERPRRMAVAREAASPRTRPTRPETAPNAVPREPSPPVIDWEHEAALEVQRDRADADRDRNYRNFAGLTPERRAWLESHHMEPAPEGVRWAHPRVEIINGLPLIWVNDHCVALPLMALLVFCSIGHIEPKGDLLEHMREADEARLRSRVP